MKIPITFVLSLVVLTGLSCKKKASPPIVIVETIVDISVDAGSILRNLSGNEVGINLDYLMDDSHISGNDFSKTAHSIQKLSAKTLRYPGGEKSDNYAFGIPPYTSASPRTIFCTFPSNEPRFINPDFTAKSSVLDFDEYMSICAQTGATPLVVVAYDAMYSQWTCGTKPTKSQLIEHAKQWVKYANVTKSYNVKLWMIGNESFLTTSYNGFTTPAQYALDIVEFADAMRSVDPSIKIIANGKSDWWATLLTSPAVSKIDYLAVSNYLPASIGSYDNFRVNQSSLNTETDRAIASIEILTTGSDRGRIGVIESEFNSIDFVNNKWENNNNLGHALCNFQMLADAICKPKVYSACLWNTRWVENLNKPQQLFDALQPSGDLNATGISLSILGKNLLTTMVNTTAGGNIKSYASYNAISKELKIFLLNKETISQKTKLSIANYISNFTFDKWEFKGAGVEDKSPVWSKVTTNQNGSSVSEITLMPNSVTMLSCYK